MKKIIIEFFKFDRTYAKAVQLYHQYGNKHSLKRQINVIPESDMLRGVLFEELREMAGISMNEFRVMMKNSVKIKVAVVAENTAAEPEKNKIEKEISLFEQAQAAFNAGDYLKTRDLLNDAIVLHDDSEEIDDKYQQLMNQFNIFNDPELISEPVKKSIKLREEFPFLKDPSCPDEFKILVSDMITAYEKYKESHEALFSASTDEELLKSCQDTVENYLENREIWDELNHYKQTGEILGTHPIFKLKLQKIQIADLSLEDLIKRDDTLKKAISRVNKQLTDEDKPHLTESRTLSLKAKNYELSEVAKEIKRRGQKK